MTDLAAAQEQLEDARKRKEEADGLIEALEQRVLDGEENAVVVGLGEEYGLQRLAELEQQRAERRVEAAEQAKRTQTLKDAQEDATDALAAVSAEVLADSYAKALAAVADLAALCRTREATIAEHSGILRAAGDTQLLVDTGDSRRMIDVAGEHFESGRYEVTALLARVAGAVMATSGERNYKPLFPRPNGLHPVERLLAAVAGEDRASTDVGWASTKFAARMVATARTRNGEAV
ncbi:hypothetical protein AB0D14_02080 [Streptomyces sp. NPDC048484]|uniref:hypothetical protein n=1 Tax=Streptomyces sp. NPDC048484 TaxID=3155146 RepID=UPI00341B2F6D